MYISYVAVCRDIQVEYFTIIPRARTDSESKAHEAYWLRGHQGERNNSEIFNSQLVHPLSTLGFPTQLIQAVNSSIFKFIWKNRRDKIKLKIMVQD